MSEIFRCKKIKWRYAVIALLAGFAGVMVSTGRADDVGASGCPELRVIFVRGSGGERYTSGHYIAFREALEEKLATTNIEYEFDDLDYPAVSIDINGHLDTLLGAYFGGGDAYEFGESVHAGVDKLVSEVNDGVCKNTKYVIGGYSQGALVVMDAIDKIDAGKVVFAATFGDPKIYLPEGGGFAPPACAGRDLSEYRAYVPDCRAYKGLIGARKPYVADGYSGKVGTWCNRYDLLCSSHYSISSHIAYAEDGLYEDASRYIFSKIVAEFGVDGNYTSPHDTVIMIDSTGSMEGLIGRYKDEAMRLASETLEKGGRVALYDYRDLADGYTPVERCNFETCTMEAFREGLESIQVDGGGDTPESLLSSSMHVMKQLDWKFGSTKSLVVLTDAGYHSPDLDGTTFYDVQKLSKQIDPVNFYIVTDEEDAASYAELAEATGGAVVSSVDELGLMVDAIMERFDSLPRVEEEFEAGDVTMPELEIVDVEKVAEDSVRVKINNSGERVIVFLNDGLVGVTDRTEFVITGLRADVENMLTLVPLSDSTRGEPVTVDLFGTNGRGGVEDDANDGGSLVVPKTPDTGVVKAD